MPLLLTMSLFGSVGTLFYIILRPLAKRYMSVKWRRIYLIINIFEYLLPLPYCYSIYKDFLKIIFRGIWSRKSEVVTTYTNVTGEVVQFSLEGIRIPDVVIYALTVGVIIAGIILLGRKILDYRSMKSYILHDTEEIASSMYNNIIQECTAKCKLTRQVRFCLCSGINTPFTIGILHPAIAIPDIEWTESDLSFALIHEMTHIKEHDNLIKILAIAVVMLNFYNPLAYYVRRQWNEIAELSCDGKVLAGKTDEEMKEYGLLVIRLAEDSPNEKKLPIMGFNLQDNTTKIRIYQMKRKMKREGPVKKIVGVGVIGVVFLASSLSVFLYSPKNVMHQDNIANEIVFYDENIEFWGDEQGDLPIDQFDGWVFIDNDGKITEIVDENEIKKESYFSCSHSYVFGELAMHYKNSNDSCKIEYYSAQKCSKCGRCIYEDLIRTTTFTQCIH